MRRHHQEVHVVGDRQRGQRRTFVIGRAAELREEILAVAGPPRGDLALEKVDEIGAGPHPLAHLRAGPGLADRRDARLDLVDKRLVDLVRLSPERHAQETGRGEIEREFFDHVVEAQGLPGPAADRRRDPGIEFGRIMPHRLGLERDRQRLPVGAMLVEIHQHQAAREQQVEHRPPALFGREDLVAVEQYELIRIGAEQVDAGAAERAIAIHRAIARRHVFRERDRIGEQFEGVADERQAVIARDMIEHTLSLTREPVRAGVLQHGVAHRRILSDMPAWQASNTGITNVLQPGRGSRGFDRRDAWTSQTVLPW